MKKYVIEASKEVVAEYTMDLNVFEMKFGLGYKMAEWIVAQNEYLNGVPYDWEYVNDKVVMRFYSVGNLVINEK